MTPIKVTGAALQSGAPVCSFRYVAAVQPSLPRGGHPGRDSSDMTFELSLTADARSLAGARFPTVRATGCGVNKFVDDRRRRAGPALLPASRSPIASVMLARSSFGHIFRNRPLDG